MLGSTRILQHEIENVIDTLVAVELPSNPDKYSTEWVLLSRVIALGLRSGGVSAAHADKDAEHDPENEDGDGKAAGSSAVPAESEQQTMSTLQYVNWCRDKALVRAKDVVVSRVRVKCIALRCATSALTTCKGDLSHIHSDIAMAKTTVQQQLNDLNNPKPDDASLQQLPCYLSLFLHDLVNFGCACASFSVEDHRILELQTAALEFLDALMHQFWNTIDPDDHTRPNVAASSEIVANVPATQKILMQFMAQIISAIRPTLSAKWTPNLQWTSGGMVFSIILDGLLNDKVVVRRLAKMLTSGPEGGAMTFQPRAAIALEVAGEVSTVEHIVNAANMARLFLLTTEYGQLVGCVDKSIQETLLAMISPHLEMLQTVWMGMAVDAARVLQNQTVWPKSLPVTDCRRGGVTYSPDVDPIKLVWHLEYALPFVSAAVALSPDMPADRIPALYSITVALLGHLHAHATEAGNSTAHINGGESFINGKKGTLEPLVLTALRSLVIRCAANAGPLAVPLSEWSHVIGFLTNDLVLNFSHLTTSSLGDCAVQSHLTAQIADALLSYLQASKDDSHEDEEVMLDKTHLTCRLWVSSIALARIVLGGMFVPGEHSDDDADVTSHEFIYPAVMIPRQGDLTPTDRWWVTQPIGQKLVRHIARSLVLCAALVDNRDMTVFATGVVVAMIPYTSACMRDDTNGKSAMVETVCGALEQLEDVSLACDATLDELWGLTGYSRDLFANDMEVSDCARLLCTCWLRLSSEHIRKVSEACLL